MAMSDRVAVVTGAGSGIGRAVALGLAQAGWRLVLAGRRGEALERVAAELPGPSLCVPTDVSDPRAVEALFAAVSERFGRLDLLFNNAGIFTPAATVDEIAVEDWLASVNVNLTGTFLCTRAAFGMMRKQDPRGGRIINNGFDRGLRATADVGALTAPRNTPSPALRAPPRWMGAPSASPAVRSMSAMPRPR
ncbi:UNVERIFIED_ORG: NAD(P)-dependent dehydrogenase (short-subunit alcohol dehydrogenase family) [Methylorubrum zatmanii]